MNIQEYQFKTLGKVAGDIFSLLDRKCPKCGRVYSDEDNKEWIDEHGYCLTLCDHLLID